jgi:hypothetical protein
MSISVDLDAPLLRLSPQDNFTFRDAVQGVLITGGIGSGKTSGSGQALAGAFLRAGMGGLVLCAKPEEAQLWRHYCAVHGRSGSLIEVDGRLPILNFLEYELTRQGVHGLNSVIECLMRVLEATRQAGASPGRVGDRFWEDSTRQLLRNAIPILYVATGTVTIPDIVRFVRSAPSTMEQAKSAEWKASAFMYEIFLRAAQALGDEHPLVNQTAEYWHKEFVPLDPKTRGNIAISLTTTLDRFNHGWLKTAFCGESLTVPELSFHGAVILLNMPALTLNDDGIIAQLLFKYMWQRAVLARNALDASQQARPVFLWADEAQYFLNSYDAEFLSTCRGSRACTVFLSQSLPTYYATMGGDHPRERVHHLLGNFATKIWHSNACAETNRWAADTLGQVVKQRANYSEGEGSSRNWGMNMGEGTSSGTNQSSGGSQSYGRGINSGGGSASWSSGSSQGESDNWGRNRGEGTSSNISQGYSEQVGYLIEPGEFGRILKTGGPANGNRVSAIWYQAGRRFAASSGNALLAEFKQ